MNDEINAIIAAAETITDPIAAIVTRVATDPAAAFEADNLLLLAKLKAEDPAAYQRVRLSLVESNVRIRDLERLFSTVIVGPVTSSGTLVDLGVVESWNKPVEGSVLLKDIIAAFERHMVLPPHAAVAMALWILFAHTHNCWSISPRLALNSPVKRCGKTTALSIIQHLVPKPLPASNITAAALFRSVQEWSPTLLIDEADSFLAGKDDLRGILDSGHNRSQAFVVRTTQPEHKPAQFSTWAPLIIALIGRLPDTLHDRSIVINLKRKRPTEKVERFRSDRIGNLQILSQQAARWAADSIDHLISWDGEVSLVLNDRAADNWRPLLAIAHAIGPEAFQMAQDASLALTSVDDDGSVAILLLADIKSLFLLRGKSRLPTEDILDHLHDLESRPWREYKNDKPLTESQLAKLLKEFGPKPKTRRFDDGTNRKGYALEEFQDAFERYLPVEAVAASQSNNLKVLMANDGVTGKSDVTVGSTSKPLENVSCDAATATGGPLAPEFEPGTIPSDPSASTDGFQAPAVADGMIELDQWTGDTMPSWEDNNVVEAVENHGS